MIAVNASTAHDHDGFPTACFKAGALESGTCFPRHQSCSLGLQAGAQRAALCMAASAGAFHSDSHDKADSKGRERAMWVAGPA